MTTDAGMFRRTLNALVQGRSRQAQRYVDAYLADRQAARLPKR